MENLFLPADAAHAVLRRLRRANFLLEEIKFGNIQRECREEICSYEEAREAFEDDEKTKQFWNEYVRESSPPGGLGTVPGGVQSLYLVVPLLLVLFVIAAVAITVWRCHSRKPTQRGLGHSHHNQVLSTVSLDHLGRDHPHRDQTELSIHSCPAFLGSGNTPGSAEDPPPSYEEAVGHTDVRIETELPPQYDDIVHSSSTRSSRGQVK
uniref:Proline rich Gla (G-carboxyglutamic acid) 1 n=1 Tax=Oryzias latipes TaxID=8090 RepID=A0A3P9MPN9_ORYLA